MLREAAFLSRAGFIVLAFDFRSYGGSDGAKSTGGLLEVQDIAAAVKLAKGRVPDSPIAIYGLGMGATAALEYMNQTMGSIIVVDSPYPTWQEAVRRSNAPWWSRFAIPGVVDARLSQLLRGYERRSSGNVVENSKPKRALSHLMVIVGERDKSIPTVSRIHLLARLMPWDAEQAYIASGAGRLQAADRDQAEYAKHILLFLDEAPNQFVR
jgi:pimeloyl-ACP methyl ester carboxylesterase